MVIFPVLGVKRFAVGVPGSQFFNENERSIVQIFPDFSTIFPREPIFVCGEAWRGSIEGELGEMFVEAGEGRRGRAMKSDRVNLRRRPLRLGEAKRHRP